MKVGLDASIPKYPKRFRWRVFFSITAITALSAVAAFSFYFFRQRRAVERERTQRGKFLVKQLAERAELGVYSGNVAFFAPFAKSMASQKDVDYITVHDLSGKEIFRHPPSEKGARGPKPLPVKILKKEPPKGSSPWIRREENRDEFVLPVSASSSDSVALAFGKAEDDKKETIGWVRVAVSRLPAMEKLEKAQKVSLYLSGGLLVFGILAAMFVTWRITGPIIRITKGAHAIRKGNLDQRVEIKSRDELGQLGDAFNRMAWNLKETMTKLETLNKNLEEEVARRTEDIRGISEFIKVLNEPLQMKPLLNASLGAFKNLSGCAAAAVYTVAPEETLAMSAQIGASPEAFGPQKTPIGEKNAGRAAQSQHPLKIDDIPENARLCLSVGSPLSTVVYVPVRFGDNLEGVLVAAFLDPPQKEGMALMEQAAQQLGVAMSNARAYEASRRLAKELEARNVDLVKRKNLLQKQKKKLIEANRLKSEFLANTTHELRTPLNAIIGYTGLIREGVYGDVSEDQNEALKGIDESAQSLLGLINQTLDYAKIESKQMPLVVSNVNLVELVKKTVSAVQGLTKDKPFKIQPLLPPKPILRKTDEGKIKQILTNLLSNAVKFTDKGGVQVALEAHPDKRVTLQVKDTGVGIDPADQGIIFEAFRQLDGSSTRAAGGTGLGLAISRKFSILFGGSLTVESQKGKGSVFTLTIPPEPPTDTKRVTEEAAGEMDDLSATMGVGPQEEDLSEESAEEMAQEKERSPGSLDIAAPKNVSTSPMREVRLDAAPAASKKKTSSLQSSSKPEVSPEDSSPPSVELELDFDPNASRKWSKK